MSNPPGILTFFTVLGWVVSIALLILWAIGNAAFFWPLIISAIITTILTLIVGGPSAFDLLDF